MKVCIRYVSSHAFRARCRLQKEKNPPQNSSITSKYFYSLIDSEYRNRPLLKWSAIFLCDIKLPNRVYSNGIKCSFWFSFHRATGLMKITKKKSLFSSRCVHIVMEINSYTRTWYEYFSNKPDSTDNQLMMIFMGMANHFTKRPFQTSVV